MDSDNECVKCGGYSGGGNLCMMCEKAALKKNAKPVRKKKVDPLVLELIEAIEPGEDCDDEDEAQCRHCQLIMLIQRARARFKV